MEILETVVVFALNPENAAYTLTTQVCIIGALVALCAWMERQAAKL